MPLPLMTIGPLINQLAKLLTVVGPIIQSITDSGGQKKDVKEAVELQAKVIKSLEEQLTIVKTVLSKIEKSLQIWAWATVSVGILSIISVTVAILKK